MSCRVLVVEDEIFVAIEIEGVVQDLGYLPIGIAADSRTALALADQAEVALVDLNLIDGPTGIQVGRTLADKGVTVLFMTANPTQLGDGVPGAIGVMPKPVTVYDYQVRLKVPLNMLDLAPQHFTNLHMGLQMARRILRKRGGENKQIFIITDGQPTAHVEGDHCYLLYPPDPRSTAATLKEAVIAAREGCRIATFALIEDYYGMDWVGFVDQLTKLTKGVAFYTSSGELANCVM